MTDVIHLDVLALDINECDVLPKDGSQGERRISWQPLE